MDHAPQRSIPSPPGLHGSLAQTEGHPDGRWDMQRSKLKLFDHFAVGLRIPVGRRVPLRAKALQGKILATPVQHTIRDHRHLALLEWRIESRAKRVLTLPCIIHPENVVENRGDRSA